MTSQQNKSPGIVTGSASMQAVLSLAEQVARTPDPVLIQGESGTGKELISRFIHEHSLCRAGPFLAENCAAIPEGLLESELFGYVRGAFTGAIQNSPGLFRLAHAGTLFLDEIANMSLPLQKNLLRVLQQGEVRSIGGRSYDKVNVRVICASNQPLFDLIQKGLFREDLYYRLGVFLINVPPLRTRPGDVALLARYFLDREAQKRYGTPPPVLAPKTLKILENYPWPGNVRELENEIKRITLLAGAQGQKNTPFSPSQSVITPDLLSPNMADMKRFSPRYGKRKSDYTPRTSATETPSPSPFSTLSSDSTGMAPSPSSKNKTPQDLIGINDFLERAQRTLRSKSAHQLTGEDLRLMLELCNGNKALASKRFNIPRRTLYRKLSTFGLA